MSRCYICDFVDTQAPSVSRINVFFESKDNVVIYDDENKPVCLECLRLSKDESSFMEVIEQLLEGLNGSSK